MKNYEDPTTSFTGDVGLIESQRTSSFAPPSNSYFDIALPITFIVATVIAAFFVGLTIGWRSSVPEVGESPLILSSNKDAASLVSDSFVPCTTSEGYYEFFKFIKKFNKDYSTLEEFAYRHKVFENNLNMINEHNSKGHSYTLGINAFADLTHEEFSSSYLCYGKLHDSSAEIDDTLLWSTIKPLPLNFDWRSKNCVTQVKNQGACGSCWAFSVTGALESAYCIRYGTLYSLSEQQLLDCSFPEGNKGCGGGLPTDAFDYVIQKSGLCAEGDYEYEADDKKCKDTKCTTIGVPIIGYRRIPHNNPKALQTAIYLHSPVTVSLDGSDESFTFYQSGVFSSKCGNKLTHSMLVTGYGTDPVTGEAFWALKNSWGRHWGEGGYMRISQKHVGPNGECSVLSDAVYPLI